jgi:hypothetical protein
MWLGQTTLQRVALISVGTALAMFTLPLLLPMPRGEEGITFCYPFVGPVQRFSSDLVGSALTRAHVHEDTHAGQCRRDGALWHFVRDVSPHQRLVAEADAYCAEASLGVANGGQARLEYARAQDELREMLWFRRYPSVVLENVLASRCPLLASAANREEADWQMTIGNTSRRRSNVTR